MPKDLDRTGLDLLLSLQAYLGSQNAADGEISPGHEIPDSRS